MTHHLNAAKEETVKALWDNPEVTAIQIAERVGVSSGSIRKVADRLGLGAKASAIPGWPDERVDRLKELHKEGLSGTQAAKRLNAEFGTNYSRCAVIAKAHRLGLTSHDEQTVSIGAKRSRAAARKKEENGWPAAMTERLKHLYTVEGRTAEQIAAQLSIEFKTEVTYPAVAGKVHRLRLGRRLEPFQGVAPGHDEPLPTSQPKPLLQRGFEECAWILGADASAEAMCCGARIYRGSWCLEHWMIGRQPSTKTQAAQDRALRALLKRA